MTIYKHYDEIYEIKNFISDETIQQILSFVNLTGDDGWFYSHEGNTMSVISDENLELFKNITNEIKTNLNSYFMNIERMEEIHNIKRLKSEEFMHKHTDLGPNNDDNNILFGIVIYLNDNFEGGELNYTDLNIKIKPVKGSLVIHKSTYMHEVLTVTSGTRYALTTFVWGNENTKLLIS